MTENHGFTTLEMACGASVLSVECQATEHYMCSDVTGATCREHQLPISCKCECHQSRI